jgi:beta-lactamase regulating signal transducer with metallopeptidase domain
MTVVDLQTLAQVFTGRLLNTAAEGLALAALVWVLLRLIGRQNSGTRFAIWFSALLAIVALPFLSGSGFGLAGGYSPANLHKEIVLPSYWGLYLFVVWGAVAATLLLRLTVGLWRVRDLLKNSSDIDLASLHPAIGGLLRDFDPGRRVRLCISNEVAIPAAIGFFDPAIVLPASLLPQLSTEEIRVAVLHELAHLRRRDDWTNLVQKIVKAVFFFHPAVWWIESRLTLEREMACDDSVLAQTASPRAYAASLISFAEKLQNAKGLALAQALVSRMHEMSLRLKSILDAKRPTQTGLWKPVLGLSAGMLVLVVGVAPYVPRLVAFQTQPSRTPTQQIQVATNAAAANPDAQAVNAASAHTVAAHVARRSTVAPQPRAIQATFNPRSARAQALPAQQERSNPAAFMILQTVQYEPSGSTVWTLCVWRVGGENRADRQLESAIVLGLI